MKRVISLIAVSLILAGLTTGCSGDDPLSGKSKSDVVSYAHQLETENGDLTEQLSIATEKLKGIQTDTVETSAITEFGDGTGRLTLNSDDSVVKLPAPFEYPNSTQSYNASSVVLTDNVYIKPSANWLVSLPGSEVQFEHTLSEISGTIKVGSKDKTLDNIKPDMLTDTITNFFANMPPDQVSYSKLYLESDWVGIDAKAHTFIDEDDAQIRCGMLGYGDVNITYVFSYKGDKDSSKDELIVSLLQTLTMYNKSLRVE